MSPPAQISTEEELDEFLSRPPPALVELMRRLDGDIAILGIAGKMGVSLGAQALRACQAAGVARTVYGVSRFSDSSAREKLEKLGVKTIACDLLDRGAVARLPRVPNVVFMAGRKFGTSAPGGEALTWAMNTVVPANVAEHFAASRIVAFSSGNVYPFVTPASGGATEETAPQPVGEYAQSVLGRERVLAYYGQANSTPLAILRLNYAVELRYGVLHEIGRQVLAGEAVDTGAGHVNVIWQGDANAQALLALGHSRVPAEIINVAGPEILSVREVAADFARLLKKEARVQGPGQENDQPALLNNAAKAARLFGYPSVTARQAIEWTAHWLAIGGRSLNKPTHFEVRDGRF